MNFKRIIGRKKIVKIQYFEANFNKFEIIFINFRGLL